jgi:integrase
MSTSMPYLKRHSNNTFYVHWTEDRIGKRKSAGTADEAQARLVLAQWLIDQSAEPDAALGIDRTLADIWTVYFKKHICVKSASIYGAELAWKQLEPFFGSLPATGLTQDAVDEYVKRRTSGKLGRKVKPNTVTRELSYIVAAVRFCADDRRKLIGPESVRRISLPEQAPPRDRWLRPHEIDAIKAAAIWYRRNGRMSRGERFVWIALETGARRQAIIDLTWSRVDFETGVIQFADPSKRKTKKRRAAVPISAALRPVLEQAYKERVSDRVLDNGGDIWPSIQSIVVRAGLAGERAPLKTGEKPAATGIGPHTFRHTFATILARKKVPIYQIAAILGNSVKMVADVYGHHAKEDLQDAVNLISGPVYA